MIEEIIKFMGGMLIVVAAITWLVRSLIAHFLTKDIESFKQRVQSESTEELERLRQTLRLVTSEHEKQLHKLREGGQRAPRRATRLIPRVPLGSGSLDLKPMTFDAPMVSVKYADLLDAFEFVSTGAPSEHSAYISIVTGKIYQVPNTIKPEEKIPEDIETSDQYIDVPHRIDLGVGRDLALAFVARELPADLDAVTDFFRHKGAYSRFKTLLESRGALKKWYAFEESATEKALREWCQECGIELFHE